VSKDPIDIEVIGRGVLTWGDFILLCRNKAGGYTYLPGGHVEFGEPAAVAVAREFEEETGMEVRVGDCLLMHEHIFRQSGRLRHEINLVFHVEHGETAQAASTPPPVASREKKISFGWCKRSELASSDLRPPVIAGWLTAVQVGDSPRPQWLSESS